MVGDAGAEHDAWLLGSGAGEPGAGSPWQVQDRGAGGRVGEFAFEGAAVFLSGQGGGAGLCDTAGDRAVAAGQATCSKVSSA